MLMIVFVILIGFISPITWTHMYKDAQTFTDNNTFRDVIDLGCFCGVPENAEYKLNLVDHDPDEDDDDGNDLLASDRVIGGEISRRGRYPWTVRLVWVCLGERALMKVTTCSASLLTPRLLASATHCFSESLERLAVSLTCARSSQGELTGQLMVDTGVNSANVPDKRKLFKIKKIIAGDGHCPFSDFGNPDCADFCLILLQRPITFSKLLRPICLPDPGQDFSGMKTASIGWGMFKINDAKVLHKLLRGNCTFTFIFI